MAEYDTTNKGAFFNNQYKEDGDSKPDFTGNLNVDGKDWKIAGWKSTSKNGKDYISLRVNEPGEYDKPQVNNSTASEDDIPF